MIPFFVRPADRIDHLLHPPVGKDPQFNPGREPDRPNIADGEAQPFLDIFRSGQAVGGVEKVAQLNLVDLIVPRSKTATNSSFTV